MVDLTVLSIRTESELLVSWPCDESVEALVILFDLGFCLRCFVGGSLWGIFSDCESCDRILTSIALLWLLWLSWEEVLTMAWILLAIRSERILLLILVVVVGFCFGWWFDIPPRGEVCANIIELWSLLEIVLAVVWMLLAIMSEQEMNIEEDAPLPTKLSKE